VLAVVGVVVVLVAGGYAVLALTGDDAPPPPRLQGTPAQEGAAPAGAGRWHPVAPAGSFVGYRVDERYLGVGVRTAVGRTSAVSGTVTVSGDRVEGADLRADMTTVRSDQARRDDALRSRPSRPIATRPRASRWRARSPSPPRPRQAKGALTLHGRRAAIAVTVRGPAAVRRPPGAGRQRPDPLRDLCHRAAERGRPRHGERPRVLEFRLVLARG
jgi:polyisoprenoid-binding protein YceI